MTAIDLAASRAFLNSPAATRVASEGAGAATIKVMSGYRNASGSPCRVIEQTVRVNGQPVRAVGTVCRRPQGVWALVP
jgi:surface antigen